MSTTAQIKANRQNSQKSTGPKSAEGKKAVSKNAVKHGLFANEAVIKGESAEDFEVFRDEMIAKVAPVGPVESMLAERFVSLSWRLKRVERMQNQAIDVMIEQDEQPSPLAKLTQSLLPKGSRLSPVDASVSNGELALGRAAIKDYSNSRVLDRLMMYERRIENSMIKTMHELERLRLLRELEQAEDGGQISPQIYSGGQSRRNFGTGFGITGQVQSDNPDVHRDSGQVHPDESEVILQNKANRRPSAENPKHEIRNRCI